MKGRNVGSVDNEMAAGPLPRLCCSAGHRENIGRTLQNLNTNGVFNDVMLMAKAPDKSEQNGLHQTKAFYTEKETWAKTKRQ